MRMSEAIRENDPASSHLIALISGLVVGEAVVWTSPEPDDRFPETWLHGIRVWRPFRGIGVGERLVEEAADIAREGGAMKLYVRVASDNAAALRFYRKLGFRSDDLPAHNGLLDEVAALTGRPQALLSRRLVQH